MLKRLSVVIAGVWFVAMVLTGLSRSQGLQWEDVIIGVIPFCLGYMLMIGGRYVIRG